MIRTLVHNKITKVVAVAGLVLVAFFVLHGHGASQQQTNVGHQTTVSATPQQTMTWSTPQQTTTSPAPQPSGMSVCGDMTEIGGDLANYQNGPANSASQELQALGVQLSKVVAETPQQSSDLNVLIQDFNTTVTDTNGGTTLGSLDQGPAEFDSAMDNDFNALMSDCAGS